MSKVKLYSTNYVYLENGKFKRFGNGQIVIESDKREIEELKQQGFNLISCADLTKEQQEELKNNILKFQ